MSKHKAADLNGGFHISTRRVAALSVVAMIAVVNWMLRPGDDPEESLSSGRLTAPPGTSVGAPRGEWRSLALTQAEGELYLATRTSVYHSADDGGSWTELALPSAPGDNGVLDVVVNQASPSTLYVAGDGLGVLRSRDAGSSWSSVSAGLPHDRVDALAMHTENHDTLYAYLDNKIYETRGGGATWRRPVDGPPAQAAALAHSTLPGSMNTGWLYAALPEGVYLSMD